MNEKEYKYQRQIDELVAQGCQMPAVFAPDNMSACRFAFSDHARQNHVHNT